MLFTTRSTNQLKVTSGAGENQTVQHFDHVVMTAPSPIVERACEGLSEDERKRLNSAEYLGVICTSLLLDRPLAGYYVTNVIDSWVPLTGIIEMGAIVDPQYLGGHYLVYLPRYLMADDAGFQETDEAIHERCLTTLEKMYPNFNRDQVAAIQTARARHVMALPTLRYSEQLPPVVCSVPGLYLLNSAQVTKGNLNVNETIEIVERELEQSVLPDAQSRVNSAATSWKTNESPSSQAVAFSDPLVQA